LRARNAVNTPSEVTIKLAQSIIFIFFMLYHLGDIISLTAIKT
jgi:hypothetical protein